VALSEPIGVRRTFKGCEVLKGVIFKGQKTEISVPLKNANYLQSREVKVPLSCLSHLISLFHVLEKYLCRAQSMVWMLKHRLKICHNWNFRLSDARNVKGSNPRPLIWEASVSVLRRQRWIHINHTEPVNGLNHSESRAEYRLTYTWHRHWCTLHVPSFTYAWMCPNQ
jgi:hypothetical protein